MPNRITETGLEKNLHKEMVVEGFRGFLERDKKGFYIKNREETYRIRSGDIMEIKRGATFGGWSMDSGPLVYRYIVKLNNRNQGNNY